MSEDKLKIGISAGDINGIGMEVILKTLEDKRILSLCTPVIYSSNKIVSYHKNTIEIEDITFHNAKDIQSLNPNAVNIINCWVDTVKINIGRPSEEGGKYAFMSLEQAVDDLKNGHIDALVTAPINKKSMQLSGFEFPGHTEYLTSKLEAKESLMLMVSDTLRVGLATNHLPISKVAAAITKEGLLEKIQLMNKTLKVDFGIEKPAIAIMGLNPHAGDEGVIGTEEIEVIIPAIQAARAQGILAIGPYSADGFFGSGNYTNFDGILAMYHDQGLVPFKTLAAEGGVNFTAGLPFVRTSPDHGTAFDIAGQNLAEADSFRQALYLAIDCTRQRADYEELTKNPLKIIEVSYGEEDEALFDEDDPKLRHKHKKQKQRERNRDKEKEPREKPQGKEQNKELQKEQNKEQNKEQVKEQSSENQEIKKEQGNTQNNQSKNLSVEERLALAAEKKKAQDAAAALNLQVEVIETKQVVVIEEEEEEIIEEIEEPIFDLDDSDMESADDDGYSI